MQLVFVATHHGDGEQRCWSSIRQLNREARRLQDDGKAGCRSQDMGMTSQEQFRCVS
ncbi:hypothetical protein BS78_04G288800 [Paspalum vaginatum]|nr:hypothetical protein BS78_04G288800 [Paspalum vaginatum]